MQIHAVRQGETLAQIASTYGQSASTIMQLNGPPESEPYDRSGFGYPFPFPNLYCKIRRYPLEKSLSNTGQRFPPWLTLII